MVLSISFLVLVFPNSMTLPFENALTLCHYSANILRRVFVLFDKDGSGEIDAGELKCVFAELGQHISAEDVQRVMDLADTDGSGTLNCDEFIEAVTKSNIVRKTTKIHCRL